MRCAPYCEPTCTDAGQCNQGGMYKAVDHGIFTNRLIVKPLVKAEDVRSELQAINALCRKNGHPNIVNVVRSERLENSGFWFVNMELCDLSLRNFFKGKWFWVPRR